MNCTKAIIPVAGYGTRRMPITKAVEKCMLPILNRPVIDFVVRDCIKAGITDIYFVVSGEAKQLKAYYSRQPQIEEYLRTNHKESYIDGIIPPEGVSFHYVQQDTRNGKYGTTVPVWLCRDIVTDDEQVLVIMGDQFLYRTDGGSNAADLLQAVKASDTNSGLIGVPIPIEQVASYGIIDMDDNGSYKQIVEHPTPETAPSNLNNASFYVFEPKLFRYLDEDMNRPHTGEYMIIDAINEFVKGGGSLIVTEAKGEYLDCGGAQNWLKANIFVSEHPEV